MFQKFSVVLLTQTICLSPREQTFLAHKGYKHFYSQGLDKHFKTEGGQTFLHKGGERLCWRWEGGNDDIDSLEEEKYVSEATRKVFSMANQFYLQYKWNKLRLKLCQVQIKLKLG